MKCVFFIEILSLIEVKATECIINKRRFAIHIFKTYLQETEFLVYQPFQTNMSMIIPCIVSTQIKTANRFNIPFYQAFMKKQSFNRMHNFPDTSGSTGPEKSPSTAGSGELQFIFARSPGWPS